MTWSARSGSAVALVLVGGALVGCSGRPYGLDCGGPRLGVEPAECEALARHVATRFGTERPGNGDLMVVAVDTVDCEVAARARESEELAEMTEAGGARCWRVELHYFSGTLDVVAARDTRTDAIGIYP